MGRYDEKKTTDHYAEQKRWIFSFNLKRVKSSFKSILLTFYNGGVFVCFSDGGGGNCPADLGVQPAPVVWETCCPRQSPVRPAGVRMVTHRAHHFTCPTSWGQGGDTPRPPLFLSDQLGSGWWHIETTTVCWQSLVHVFQLCLHLS